MDRQQKELVRIIVSLCLFAAGFAFKKANPTASIILFVSAYVLCGYDVIFTAARNITKGKVFDENFLMTIASIGAMVLAENAEGAAEMIFYQIGEWLQRYAVNRSRKSIGELMDICPDYANIEEDGVLVQVDPDDVEIGQRIIVKPGEKIPLDGTVTDGSSTLDTSALTGESVPVDVSEGSEVLSGCINLNRVIEVEVTREFDDSTATRILELIEDASSEKSKAENFISVFARYYTPSVVICALALAFIPPLILQTGFSDWIYRALIFLVVSCPCALVISIPLGFFGGIGACSSSGVLVKGSNYLEALSKAEIMVFDKTGTLTEGVFSVSEINAEPGVSEEELIETAALAENYSDHPLAQSVKRAYAKPIDSDRVDDVEDLTGFGISATVDGEKVLVGRYSLMKPEENGIRECESVGTAVYVMRGGKYLGNIVLMDREKADSKEAIEGVKNLGIRKTVMLTGDRKNIADYMADRLGIDDVYSELLPADKVEKVRQLLGEKSENGKLVFVGDGLNDAPVLTLADIGIAMGGLGSDAAIEASDIVIMDDRPSRIITGYKIARKTLAIVKENIVFAIGVKLLVMVLGAFGMATMWEAIFADVGVAVIAILNAVRVLGYRA